MANTVPYEEAPEEFADVLHIRRMQLVGSELHIELGLLFTEDGSRYEFEILTLTSDPALNEIILNYVSTLNAIFATVPPNNGGWDDRRTRQAFDRLLFIFLTRVDPTVVLMCAYNPRNFDDSDEPVRFAILKEERLPDGSSIVKQVIPNCVITGLRFGAAYCFTWRPEFGPIDYHPDPDVELLPTQRQRPYPMALHGALQEPDYGRELLRMVDNRQQRLKYVRGDENYDNPRVDSDDDVMDVADNHYDNNDFLGAKQ